MEEIENELIYETDTGINKYSLDNLFKFLSTKLEYYEFINDPILQCLLDCNQFDRMIKSEKSKSVIFFFFVEKKFVKFQSIKTGLLI